MSRSAWWGLGWGRRVPPEVPAVPTEVDLPQAGRTRIAQAVDCRGAMCPRPQLLTMKVMHKMNEGDVVEVRCDSAAAVEGLPSLALKLASTHLCTLREPDGWRVYLRKGA